MEPLDNEATPSHFNHNPVVAAIQNIKNAISEIVVGQDEIVEQMLIATLVGGHILLEGVPGVAKTLLARTLSQTLKTNFGRIQFTPDLMPSDIVGSQIFNPQTAQFSFRPGPVFANILLTDEINRAPAKTQAALLEVMEERQITVDGHSYPLAFPFVVIATQNPIEQDGTYRLPEAQLDRFLIHLVMGHPDAAEEVKILERFQYNFDTRSYAQVATIIDAETLLELRNWVEKVTLRSELLDYIVQIVQATRQHERIALGASPRGSLSILKAAKGKAAIQGRDFVIPEDIQNMVKPCLRHRIILTPEAELEGVTSTEILAEIVQRIEVPR